MRLNRLRERMAWGLFQAQLLAARLAPLWRS